VEHPVTEMVSGVDLVAEQLAIANGEGLRPAVQHAALSGHAIECRINAEDPANDFLPSPGRVALAQWPSLTGVRVDTWIETGSEVPPWYDSLLGKIIAHGATRAEALARLRSALAATRIDGVATNLALLEQLVASTGFSQGGVHTGWLAECLQPAVTAGANRG
jgi:acetyl-CoA carboxylase biotin carboxylase subunit